MDKGLIIMTRYWGLVIYFSEVVQIKLPERRQSHLQGRYSRLKLDGEALKK